MLLGCPLLLFHRSCAAASFLSDCAPPLLTWFPCIHSNPDAFSFSPTPFFIQNLPSLCSSACLSSGFKNSGRKVMILLSFVLIETGAGLKIEVNRARYLIKALHRAVALSLLPFQPLMVCLGFPKAQKMKPYAQCMADQISAPPVSTGNQSLQSSHGHLCPALHYYLRHSAVYILS